MARQLDSMSYCGVGTFKSFLLGFGVFVLGSASATWLELHDVHGWLALIDNLATGIAAGLIGFAYERWHCREAERNLEVVRLMNHHVRNDLQIIVYATSPVLVRNSPPATVKDAVKHIEWALREVLPGEPRPSYGLAPVPIYGSSKPHQSN